MWINRAVNFGLTYHSMVILIFLSLLATITEVFGVSVFLPIFQFIKMDGDVSALTVDSIVWKKLVDLSVWIGIEVTIGLLLFISFSFFLMRQLFTYLRIIYAASINYGLLMELRNQMFAKYLNADAMFYDKFSIGNLVNAMTTELVAAVIGIMAPLGFVVMSIMGIGYTIILLLLSWEMTVASIVIFLIVLQIPKVWISKSRATGRGLANSNTVLSEFLVGRLKSPRLVRLSNMQLNEQHDFMKLTRFQHEHSMTATSLHSKTEVVIEPIIIGLSLTFIYISYSVIGLDVEVIGLYLVVMIRMMPLVKGLIVQWQKIQRYIGSIEVVEDRINAMDRAKEEDLGNKKLSGCTDAIYFEDVCYKYSETGKNILKNVALTFPAGKVTALVGPSGSGKSTLIDLIPRIRIPSHGFIKIDNCKINQLNLESLRSEIAYVSQSSQIFKGTVFDHIKYGTKNVSYEDVVRGAKLAGADDFIREMPKQYETILSDDGINLSGGQNNV